MLELRYENVPPAAVPVLIEQLEGFGARFTLPAHRGEWAQLDHVSGTVIFRHHADVLTVQLIEDRGHFPQAMLIGGIRQLVEEAVELVQGTSAADGRAIRQEEQCQQTV